MEFSLTGEPGNAEKGVGRRRSVDVNAEAFVPGAEWKGMAVYCREYAGRHTTRLTDAMIVQLPMASAQDWKVWLNELVEQDDQTLAHLVTDHTLDLFSILIENLFLFGRLCFRS